MGWLVGVLGGPAETETAPPCRSCGRSIAVVGLVCIRICEGCVVASASGGDGGRPDEAA